MPEPEFIPDGDERYAPTLAQYDQRKALAIEQLRGAESFILLTVDDGNQPLLVECSAFKGMNQPKIAWMLTRGAEIMLQRIDDLMKTLLATRLRRLAGRPPDTPSPS